MVRKSDSIHRATDRQSVRQAGSVGYSRYVARWQTVCVSVCVCSILFMLMVESDLLSSYSGLFWALCCVQRPQE